MGFMEYADASDNYGPRPPKYENTTKTLEKQLSEVTNLVFLIDHPRYKEIFAEVDPHINMAVYPGVQIDSYAFILLVDDELVALQKKTSHWHKHHTRTSFIKKASPKEQKRLVDLFKERVSLLMGQTPPRSKRNKNME